MRVIVYTTDQWAERSFEAAAKAKHPGDTIIIVRSTDELARALDRDPTTIRTVSYAGTYLSIDDTRKHIKRERQMSR